MVICKALDILGYESLSARQLLLGTALAESRLKYTRQVGGGPALGFYQMEPATAHDIMCNYVRYRPDLRARLESIIESPCDIDINMQGATAFARIHYLRVPEALPAAGDYAGLAIYHKKFYNTYKGKANPFKNEIHFKKAIEFIGE